MADCPHCKRFFRCADCERNQAEVGLIAHEIVFWRYQAIWYRARIYCSQPQEPDSVDLKRPRSISNAPARTKTASVMPTPNRRGM